MTTAQYRKLASEHEEKLNWKSAAEFWGLAIDNYPNAKGELAKRDMAMMARNKKSCEDML